MALTKETRACKRLGKEERFIFCLIYIYPAEHQRSALLDPGAATCAPEAWHKRYLWGATDSHLTDAQNLHTLHNCTLRGKIFLIFIHHRKVQAEPVQYNVFVTCSLNLGAAVLAGGWRGELLI